MVKPAGGAGDSSGQVEIKKKVLTEPPARDDPVSRDDFAQRR
jgi:hypothetical protein